MAALVMSVPTGPGVNVTINSSSGSDTITSTQLGSQGCNLVVRTAGTINTITVTDSGLTPASNPATVTGKATVATGTTAFYISPSQVNLGTGLVTVTAVPNTAVTYELYSA
jgi:hypothetical protein